MQFWYFQLNFVIVYFNNSGNNYDILIILVLVYFDNSGNNSDILTVSIIIMIFEYFNSFNNNSGNNSDTCVF
jgi:hypothetical protein